MDIPRRRRIRYQRLGRVRRGRLANWLASQAARFGAPIRAVRDRIRFLGPLTPRELAEAVTIPAWSSSPTIWLLAFNNTLYRWDTINTTAVGGWIEDGFAVGQTIQVETPTTSFRARIAAVTAVNIAVEPGAFEGFIYIGGDGVAVYAIAPRAR